jgi:hypothetical protein
VLGGSGAATELSGDELGHRIRWDVNRARAFQKAVKMEKIRRTRLGECAGESEGTEVAGMVAAVGAWRPSVVVRVHGCNEARWGEMLVGGRGVPP